jgi:hypothetical protein
MIGEYLHAGLCVWVVGRLEPEKKAGNAVVDKSGKFNTREPSLDKLSDN